MAIKSRQLFGILIEQRDQLGLTLSPSWLSGLAIITISILIIFGAIISLNYGGSSFHLELESNKVEAPALDTGTYEYNDINDKFSANALISSIPLFIFWAAVGLVTYSFTMSIFNALRKVVDLEQEMNYVHADRNELLRNAIERLAIRIVVLFIWFLYIQFTMHLLVPYAIAVAYAASGAFNILHSIVYLLWAIMITTICLHIHVVLMRLLLLRPRAFGQPGKA